MRRFCAGLIISNNELGTISWENIAWGGVERKIFGMKIFCTSQGWNRFAKNRCRDFRAFALGRFLSTLVRSSLVRFKGGSPSNIRLFSSRLARGDGV